MPTKKVKVSNKAKKSPCSTVNVKKYNKLIIPRGTYPSEDAKPADQVVLFTDYNKEGEGKQSYRSNYIPKELGEIFKDIFPEGTKIERVSKPGLSVEKISKLKNLKNNFGGIVPIPAGVSQDTIDLSGKHAIDTKIEALKKAIQKIPLSTQKIRVKECLCDLEHALKKDYENLNMYLSFMASFIALVDNFQKISVLDNRIKKLNEEKELSDLSNLWDSPEGVE